MIDIINKDAAGCGDEKVSCACGSDNQMMPFQMAPADDGEVCCGRPAEPPSGTDERPGYTLCGFVEEFVRTPAGAVPKVKTRLDRDDYLGTISTRVGISRYNYKVTPGLYCVGTAGKDAPVFVSANYKLSFDALRSQLGRLSAWILVLDTRGINVWCAAGKGTFSTREIVRQVRNTNLEKVVDHRELIVPQLGATGVSAHQVKKTCGFKVIYGPVRAGDIKQFIREDKKADPAMRQVTFTLSERLVLIPVEVSLALKPLMWALLAVFLISGIGPHIFSISAAWHRGLTAAAAVIAGIAAGAAAVPAFLPRIPGVSFSLKGVVTGAITFLVMLFLFWTKITFSGLVALMLCTVSISSYLAMNFTGTTPFTSPSGVEKEMRKAMPLQAGALTLAVIFWIGAGFSG